MVKNLRAMQETCMRHGFDSLVRNIPWRRKWQPTPVLLPGRSHGQRSLVGYSPWGCKMSDMIERLNSNNNNSTERKMYFWASQKISVTCWYSARSKDHKFKWWGCVFTDFLEPSSFGLDTLLLKSQLPGEFSRRDHLWLWKMRLTYQIWERSCSLKRWYSSWIRCLIKVPRFDMSLCPQAKVCNEIINQNSCSHKRDETGPTDLMVAFS